MIKVRFTEEGKISVDTMRALFAAIKASGPEFGAEFHFTSFLVGMRCYERLLKTTGQDPEGVLDGVTVIELKE